MPVLPMREDLVPGDEARRIILQDAHPLESELLALNQARNRILAQDLKALRTQPPFAASAMDGYGVQQVDLAALPATLEVIGESAAGHPFAGTISSGQAVRIFTGGVVPDGVDTIVIQENADRDEDRVTVRSGVPAGKFIRPAGMDFKTGETLLAKGDRLDTARLSLAASMNHAEVPVYRKPLVAVLATGDELVPPGGTLTDGQIIASNSYGVGALVEAAGGNVLDMGIAKDTRQSLSDHGQAALDQGADIIVTMGGASVGDHDLVKPVFEELGFQFIFIKIAMRPGKPLLYAIREKDGKRCVLIGLAGNPVSSIVAGSVFLRPLIQQLAGFSAETIEPVSAVLDRELPENDEREEYMRAIYTIRDDGKLGVTPFTKQDSSMLAVMVRANCLLIRPKFAPAMSIGAPCKIILL